MFTAGILTKDIRFMDYKRRYETNVQHRKDFNACRSYWEAAVLEAEQAHVANRGISAMGAKPKENDKKGKQKTKKFEAKGKKRTTFQKRDGFDPNMPLTMALIDEDWNNAEWHAFPRATKDYITKHRAARKRSAASMSTQVDDAQSRVTFAEPLDDAGNQFAQPNRRQRVQA
jgi:hypothetical protein